MEDKNKFYELKRVGNFVFERGADDDGAKYVRCKSVSDNWAVIWRDDTLMYGILYPLALNDDAENYLHSLVTLMYVATTYPHDLVSLNNNGDAPFMNGFLSLVEAQNTYENSIKAPVTDEEDNKILEQTVMTEELRNDILLEEENGRLHEQAD